MSRRCNTIITGVCHRGHSWNSVAVSSLQLEGTNFCWKKTRRDKSFLSLSFFFFFFFSRTANILSFPKRIMFHCLSTEVGLIVLLWPHVQHHVSFNLKKKKRKNVAVFLQYTFVYWKHSTQVLSPPPPPPRPPGGGGKKIKFKKKKNILI